MIDKVIEYIDQTEAAALTLARLGEAQAAMEFHAEAAATRQALAAGVFGQAA